MSSCQQTSWRTGECEGPHGAHPSLEPWGPTPGIVTDGHSIITNVRITILNRVSRCGGGLLAVREGGQKPCSSMILTSKLALLPSSRPSRTARPRPHDPARVGGRESLCLSAERAADHWAVSQPCHTYSTCTDEIYIIYRLRGGTANTEVSYQRTRGRWFAGLQCRRSFTNTTAVTWIISSHQKVQTSEVTAGDQCQGLHRLWLTGRIWDGLCLLSRWVCLWACRGVLWNSRWAGIS